MFSTLDRQHWAYNMWRQWANDNPDFSLFLTRAMQQWPTLFPDETLERAEMEHEFAPQTSEIDWLDFQMSYLHNDETGEEYLDPDEMRLMAVDVENRVAKVVNEAAMRRLIEITTSSNMEEATQMDLSRLLYLIDNKSTPLERFAFHQGPVSLEVQILWLVAWWIQDLKPAGVPSPSWLELHDGNWPAPNWDWTNPPKPRWIAQFGRYWKNRPGN